MQRAVVASRRAFATSSSSSAATATPKQSFWSLREMGSVGRWMRDQPNAVPETQKYFTTTAGPTYVKKESDKFVMMTVAGVMGAGALMMVSGESLGGGGARASRVWFG